MGASAGRVLLIPKGDWNANTTYTGLDWVRHNGAAWVCKNTCTNIEPTPANTNYWQLISKDGNSVTADTAMSDSSTNAVQNKVIKSYVDNSIAGISDMTGATATQNGAHGFVPAPQAGDEKKVLLGDGTWGAIDDKFSFSDHDTATSDTSFTDAEDGNMLVTDWTKNLLNPTLETVTQNGVTCTRNVDANGKPDGTYTLNGTATKEVIFNFLSSGIGKSLYKNTVGKTLKFLNGGAINPPVGRFILNLRDGNKWWPNEQRNNSIFTVSEGYAETVVDLHIYKDQTVTDLIVKPMLTMDLEATIDDFVPYSGYDIKTCGKNLVGIPDTINKPTINSVDGTITFGAYTETRTIDSYLRLYSKINLGNIERFRIIVESEGVTLNSNSTYVMCKTGSFTVFSTGRGDNRYVSDVLTSSSYGGTIDEITVVVTKNYLYPGGTYKVAIYDADSDYSDIEPYKDGGTVHIDPSTQFPLLGLKSFDGETNIISPGNVKCVYPTNESGKGVLDSLYNKDKMLTEQKESLSVIGKCKNLLNPTLQTTTQNGITCTRNVDAHGKPDGTYTLNGTASNVSSFTFYSTLQSGKYKAVGCPSDGNLSTYTIQNKKTNNNGEILAEDSGNGAVFELSEETLVCSYIRIASGYSCDNLIFKPMLTTNLSATYDDFVPYTGEGETLTHDVAEIKNDLGGLSFSASGTTLTITDGTNTWTLEANS